MTEKTEHVLSKDVSEFLHHCTLHPDSKHRLSDANFAGTRPKKWKRMSVEWLLIYWTEFNAETRERATRAIRCLETDQPFAVFPKD